MSLVVTLDRGSYTTCTVNLFGGTITSWRIYNEEQLFMSRQAIYSGDQPIMGGVSLSFPHFADWKFGPFDGFAHTIQWELEDPPTKLDQSEDIAAVFSVSDTPYTHAMWKFPFKLQYRLILREKRLDTEFTVENTGKHFTSNFMLMRHSFFRVPNIENISIGGFKNKIYLDAVDNGVRTEENEFMKVEGLVQRTYKDALDDIVIYYESGSKMKIISTNLPDAIAFNTGPEVIKDLPFIGDDEYRYMMCIGNGIVNSSITLKPQESLKAKQSYLKIDPDDELPPISFTDDDMFAGIC